MTELQGTGRIVILNGPPRSGKSSIAAAIQARFDGVWMNLGVDHTDEKNRPEDLAMGRQVRFYNYPSDIDAFEAFIRRIELVAFLPDRMPTRDLTELPMLKMDRSDTWRFQLLIVRRTDLGRLTADHPRHQRSMVRQGNERTRHCRVQPRPRARRPPPTRMRPDVVRDHLPRPDRRRARSGRCRLHPVGFPTTRLGSPTVDAHRRLLLFAPSQR
jgi:hypothetical protein